MEPIDYRSDFSFLLEITDKKGNVLPLSEVDFDGQAYTAVKPGFAFARKDGECRNCAMRGDKVLIICDNHGMRPGTIKVDLHVHYPDELYPDGVRTEVLTVNTDMRLSSGCGCKPTDIIAEVTATTPTYIKGGIGAGIQAVVVSLPGKAYHLPALLKAGEQPPLRIVKVAPSGGQLQGDRALRRSPRSIGGVQRQQIQPAQHHRKSQQQGGIHRQYPFARHPRAPFPCG